MNRIIPRALACAMALLLTPALLFAQAPATSKPPVRILVGFAPGGGADIIARLFADKMREPLGATIIVENRTGAGGRIAAEALKNAVPDGNTILLTPIVIPVLAPLIYTNLSFDPAKDFAPLSLVGFFQFGFAVGGTHPAKTMQEYVAWVKANPQQANFGSPAPGSLPHFFGAMIGRSIGVDMQHIAYKGGAPMLNDLVGGQIPAGIDTHIELLELDRSGKIRVLASSGASRSPLLPSVPTFKEAGFTGIEGSGWYAFYAPAKTPAAAVDALSRAIVAVTLMPEVKERLTRMGVEVQGSTPAQLAKLMADDTAKWGPVIKASGFKGE
jgi:tripartite-type tricarboxylate transporter receptor subunit TctC